MQLGARRRVQPARVVSGDHGVEAEGEGAVEHGGELDPLVAPDARVRRASGGVLGHEVVDHVGLEALTHVPHVERDVEEVGNAASVVGVFAGAAAPAT
jgi:hypothetical protein